MQGSQKKCQLFLLNLVPWEKEIRHFHCQAIQPSITSLLLWSFFANFDHALRWEHASKILSLQKFNPNQNRGKEKRSKRVSQRWKGSHKPLLILSRGDIQQLSPVLPCSSACRTLWTLCQRGERCMSEGELKRVAHRSLKTDAPNPSKPPCYFCPLQNNCQTQRTYHQNFRFWPCFLLLKGVFPPVNRKHAWN